MLEYISSEYFPSNVKAIQSNRFGDGRSISPYDQFNLARHVGDNEECVLQNRAKLREFLPSDPIWLNQVHGTDVVELNGDEVQLITADASFTFETNVVCAVMTADCLPILLYDFINGSVVCAIHCGWRSLSAGILDKVIRKIGVPVKNLAAWLGPCIGQDNFEVGDDVREVFIRYNPLLAHNQALNSYFEEIGENRFLCDLYSIAVKSLSCLGVVDVYGKPTCTYEQDEVYFSYRRDGVTGRMATLIWID